MHYLIIPVIAFVLALLPNNIFLNLLGHYTLKLIWLGILALAIGCLVFPIFVKTYDMGGAIIFLAPILALVAVVPFLMERFAYDIRRTRGMTTKEKWEDTLKTQNKLNKDLQEEIEKDSRKAKSFFISSDKRRRLNRDVLQARSLQMGVSAMAESAREEYEAELRKSGQSLDNNKAELSEENFHPSLRHKPKPSEKK